MQRGHWVHIKIQKIDNLPYRVFSFDCNISGSVAVSSHGRNTGGNTLCSVFLEQLVGSHSAATGHVFAECMVF